VIAIATVIPLSLKSFSPAGSGIQVQRVDRMQRMQLIVPIAPQENNDRRGKALVIWSLRVRCIVSHGQNRID
jgi:hypothetical protein